MKKKSIIAVFITSVIIMSFAALAYSECTKYYANVHKLWYNPTTHTCYAPTQRAVAAEQGRKVGWYNKNKRIIKWTAFGAGAGYVLSGKKHRTTNVLKGAAIGSGASILTKKRGL